MTNEPTLCRSLAMHPREEPPVHGAHVAHHEGRSTPPRRGYQRLIIPREMRAEEEPPAKVANPANRGNLVLGPTHAITLLPPHVPCIVCGGTDRWDDAGIWRCVVCWPGVPGPRGGVRGGVARSEAPLFEGAPEQKVTPSRRSAPCRHGWHQAGRQATCGLCAFTIPIVPVDQPQPAEDTPCVYEHVDETERTCHDCRCDLTGGTL
jgi:hypothetical protein